MSAETLRRAAALMRELAEAVPTSPWFAIDIPVGRAKAEREWIVDSETRLIAGNVGIATDPTAEPLSEHIASWHPAVALAVADWLEESADDVDRGLVYDAHALTVARAYLGESA